MRSWRSWA